MKNILVTGGAGFIGSHLIDALLTKKNRIWCVDNFITGQKRNIEHLVGNKNFVFIKADVIDPVERYLPKKLVVDEIYHLASPASPVGYQNSPIKTYMVNSFGTHFLCEYATKIGAKLLYTSTSEVYGDPNEHPQKESYHGNVSIRGVRACYDESKRFGETVQTVWARKYKLNIRTVRIFNTYGPRMDPKDERVFPNFISQAIRNKPLTIYGKGLQTRSYCYVSDLVKGLIMVMDSEDARGKVYNLGNPDERTVLEVAKKIIKLANSNSKIEFKTVREDDPSRRRPDITKVQTELDWEPTVSLNDGLAKTIDNFREQMGWVTKPS